MGLRKQNALLLAVIPAALSLGAARAEDAPRVKLKAGDPAPAFKAKDATGGEVKLEDFKGKRVILWFYPKADTPG